MASSSIEVDLTFKVVINPDGSATIQAASNLPDGTQLLGNVAQKPTGTPKRFNGYQGGQTQTLSGGTAVFGPYSKQGGELPKGKYDVTVTMPIAANQPEAVKAIIGPHGENLTGSQVEHEYGNAFVMVEHTLTVK